jgi:hypothetical protein
VNHQFKSFKFDYLDKLNIKFWQAFGERCNLQHLQKFHCLLLYRIVDKTTSARQILSIDFDICIILIEHIIFCFDVWFVCARVWARPVFTLADELSFDFFFFLLRTLQRLAFFHFNPRPCFYFCVDATVVWWSVILWFDFIHTLPRSLCLWTPPCITSEHWNRSFPLWNFDIFFGWKCD